MTTTPRTTTPLTAMVHGAVIELGDTGAELHPLSIVLSYDPVDPYAVTLHFEGTPDTNDWVVARNLLADGLHGPAVGDGRLRVATFATSAGDLTILTFFAEPEDAENAENAENAEGPPTIAEVVLGKDDLMDFLADADDVVPSGLERHLAGLARDSWLTAVQAEHAAERARDTWEIALHAAAAAAQARAAWSAAAQAEHLEQAWGQAPVPVEDPRRWITAADIEALGRLAIAGRPAEIEPGTLAVLLSELLQGRESRTADTAPLRRRRRSRPTRRRRAFGPSAGPARGRRA